MISQPAIAMPRQRTRQQHQPRSRGFWITGLIAAASALVFGGLMFAGLGDSPPPATNPNMGAGVNDTDNDQDAQISDATATPTATFTHTATFTATATPVPNDSGQQSPTVLQATPTAFPMQPSPVVITATPIPVGPGVSTTILPPTAYPYIHPTISPEDLAGIEEWLVIDEFDVENTLWSPDGRYLYVVDDAVVNIYDMQSPQVKTASSHQGIITTIALHPFGNLLATGAEDGEVHLHILPEVDNWVGLEVCDCTITEVSFSPNGSHLIVLTDEGALHLYALPGSLAFYP